MRISDWSSDVCSSDLRVTCFGKMHEKAAKIGKGDLVRITGRVRQASYEANGERQYTVDLIVERMSALVKAGGVLGAKHWLGPIRMMRNTLGTICDPHTAWLLLRRLETVELRMSRAIGRTS